MFQPDRPEIDYRTSKLLVGVIALSLAGLTSLFAKAQLASISESYHEGGWSQTILIGFLFAIAAFLLSYNGQSQPEMLASKTASVAALGVAMFPCRCGTHVEIIPNVHAISAAVMFAVLAFFCGLFYQRALGKGHKEAKRRAFFYGLCGVVMGVAVVALIVDGASGALTRIVPRFTFWGEAIALIAFGVSWLTASKVFRFLARDDERLKLFDRPSQQEPRAAA